MKQIVYANIFSSVYICQGAAVSQSQTHQGKEKTLELFITPSSPAILYEWYPVEYLQVFCDLVNNFIVERRKAAFQSDRESFITCTVWKMI